MMHFPLSVVCVWFSHWPLERSLNMRCTMSLSLPILYQRGQCRKWLETNLCYKKILLRKHCAWCYVSYAQRHLSIHSLRHPANREVLQESPLLPLHQWDMMLVNFDHWHFLFHAFPKTTASLPLRNYSNDLQQCMFSYSLLWEYENAYWHLNYLCKAQTRPSGGNHHVWSPQSLRIKEEPGQTHIIQTSQTGFAYKDKKQKKWEAEH